MNNKLIDRKNDAALRLSKLLWAYQRGELTRKDAVVQAKADPDIVLFWGRRLP